MNDKFLQYRNSVLSSLDKHEVSYKLFGGAVICLIDDKRETEDLDIAIRADIETAERFIDALVDCGFGDREFVSMQVYGEGADPGENMYSTCHMESTNPDWKEFHIDLCFNLGEHSYDTMPSETYNDEGLQISIVPFDYIARMKANIIPRPRPKDIDDIQIIAKHLGVDPSTGKPLQETKKRSRIMDIFGR